MFFLFYFEKKLAFYADRTARRADTGLRPDIRIARGGARARVRSPEAGRSNQGTGARPEADRRRRWRWDI